MSLQGTYTLARAQQSFRSLVHIHEKNGEHVDYMALTQHPEIIFNSLIILPGWFTPPQADG